MPKKIVLAYSGGLDTSVILKWLQNKYSCPVVTFTADIGQGDELSPIETKAKNLGNPDTIVQIEAGYSYKVPSDIIISIDKGEYKFYTTEDLPTAAWTEEDAKVIFAMKKGLELKVTGESSRGPITNDSYTLNGFTASYNKLINDC